MRVLVACEESQAVAIEFRKLGHEAYSCDIEPCSGGHPEWHIQHDVLPLINGYCEFETADGMEHEIDSKWDLLIAFSPCTFLTVTGNKWFKEEYKDRFPTRIQDREEAIKFFMKFVNADCDRIAIENPIGIMSTQYRKPDQIIQPYYFGSPQRKSTCLWIKGLPKLRPTDIVEPQIIKAKNGKSSDCSWHLDTMKLNAKERSKQRSKTFLGIAQAIATQWSIAVDEQQAD